MRRKRGAGAGSWRLEGSVEGERGADLSGSTRQALQGSLDGEGRERSNALEASKSDPWCYPRPEPGL
jgi:hypothetical protein